MAARELRELKPVGGIKNHQPDVVQELMLAHLTSGMKKPTQTEICKRLKIHQSSFYLLFYGTLKQYAVDNPPKLQGR